MTTKFEVGDVVVLKMECVGQTLKYGKDDDMELGGEDGQPIFHGALSVRQVDEDDTIQLNNHDWYHVDWLKYYDDSLNIPEEPVETLEDKIDGLVKDMAIVKEILGVIEDDNI
jgi:hypothetical protein